MSLTEDNWTRKDSVLLGCLMLVIIIVGGLVCYYFVWIPDHQLIQKWKDDIAKQNIQRLNERKIIDSETCAELKLSISNNQFQLADQYAQQHYIGKCT